jgi:exodeoxyribonuclease VIII
MKQPNETTNSNCDMLDVMVDLETRGNKPGCQILSIGAVFFNPCNGSLGPQYYRVVAAKGQEEIGLHEDVSTMEWWNKQSAEARLVIDQSELSTAMDLHDCLDEFEDYLKASAHGLKKVRIWGNGADFDNAILAVAHMACQRNVPWDFWNNRCFRTLKALAPDIKMAKGLVCHNALNDAIMQAEHANKIMLAICPAPAKPNFFGTPQKGRVI